MTRYVLGFAFDDAGDNVVLIKKTKPAWQAGKYNGVGGKVEAWETGFKAMIREFDEEAGVYCNDWVSFAAMSGPEWTCECFYVFDSAVVQHSVTVTEEEICTFSVQQLPETISNVSWLIAAARNHHETDCPFTLEAKYV